MITSQKQKLISLTAFIIFIFFHQDLFASPVLFPDAPEKIEITVSVIRGPYLQSGTPYSIIVRWRTNEDTESVIHYGTALGELDFTVQDNTLKSDHELTLTGLSPETVYYYEIANLAEILVPQAADLYFKTSPVSGQAVPVNIWVLGDCGTADQRPRDVRDAFYTYNDEAHIDLMLLLGDNAYNDGTDEQYQHAIFENMYEDRLQNTVVWSTLGNHDGHSANGNSQTGPYFDIFTFPTQAEAGGVASGTEAYYSFDYANIHFIILDSYDIDRAVGSPMYLWAENDIQNTTADWIIAFWHHPVYSKGSHDSDNCSGCSDMRENYLPMLESNGVDLVMGGHSHSYERSYLINGHYGESTTFDPNIHIVEPTGARDGKVDGEGPYEKDLIDTEGAVYIVAGTSGKKDSQVSQHPAHYFYEGELGSLSIKIDGNELNAKFVRETGAIDDYFTILKLELLPVELLSFKAELFRENVRLSWQVASENRNLGFEIYRSIDSDPERSGWKKIGWLDGKGTSSEKQSYFFYDDQPSQGINYYRLKQMDVDGQYEFTNIVSVDFYDKNADVSIFPNPAQDKIFIGVPGDNLIEDVMVFDLSGKALVKTELQNQNLDISMLKNGIYYLEIKIKHKIFQERLVVLR